MSFQEGWYSDDENMSERELVSGALLNMFQNWTDIHNSRHPIPDIFPSLRICPVLVSEYWLSKLLPLFAVSKGACHTDLVWTKTARFVGFVTICRLPTLMFTTFCSCIGVQHDPCVTRVEAVLYSRLVRTLQYTLFYIWPTSMSLKVILLYRCTSCFQSVYSYSTRVQRKAYMKYHHFFQILDKLANIFTPA